MTTGEHQEIHLRNQSALNVATLLQEDVGSTRIVAIDYDSFPLDDDLVARNLDGKVRLTRLRYHVLADGEMKANVELECVRCLTRYEQAIEGAFSEQFRQLHDVQSGEDLSEHRDFDTETPEDIIDEEAFVIDESHEIDLAEAIRQNLVLAIPMMPVCGDDCPGLPIPVQDKANETERRPGQFDVLAALLDEDSDDVSGPRD